MKLKLSLLLMSMIGFTYANIIGGTGPYTNITSYGSPITMGSGDNAITGNLMNKLALVDARGKIFISGDGINWEQPSSFPGVLASKQYFSYSEPGGVAYFWRKSAKTHFNIKPKQTIQPGNNVLKLSTGESLIGIGSLGTESDAVALTTGGYTTKGKMIWVEHSGLWIKVPGGLKVLSPTDVIASSANGYMLFGKKNTELDDYLSPISINMNPCLSSPGNNHQAKPTLLTSTPNGYYAMCGGATNAYLYYFKTTHDKWTSGTSFSNGVALPSTNASDYSYVASQSFSLPSQLFNKKVSISGNAAVFEHPSLTVIVGNYTGSKGKSQGALFAKLCVDGHYKSNGRDYGNYFDCSAGLALTPPKREVISAGTLVNFISSNKPADLNYNAVFVTKNPDKANRVLDIPITIKIAQNGNYEASLGTPSWN